MDPAWLLLLLPIAAAGGWIMASRAPGSDAVAGNTKKLPAVYFKGLDFLLNEQPDKALQAFLEAVEVDSDTIEIHMALGNLFRRRGETERAIRIHQNLVTRADLDARLRSAALFELAQDYLKAGLFDRAENLFQELKQIPQYQESACRFLLQIYDQEKEWLNAIAVTEDLQRFSEHDYSEALAQYHCELAESAMIRGSYEQAERDLDAAFECYSHCVRAVIQSGRIASMKGNHHNAIGIWRELEHWAPEALGEVVEHIANSYRVLGDSRSLRQFLQSALHKNPDPRIITMLVELTRREQGEAQGHALLVDLVRQYPNFENLSQLMTLKGERNLAAREGETLSLLALLLPQVVSVAREYHCRQCGFNSHSLHWQCPGCKAWGSVQKRISNRVSGSAVRSTAG